MNNILKQIEVIVGSKGILLGEDVAGRVDSWSQTSGCLAKAIVRPGSTQEVSEVLKICHSTGQTVVTHGGLTGLAGGAICDTRDIVLSLERMRAIEAVDTVNRSMRVEAGVALQTVQEAAEATGLLFPLDLGARGSCTIGGNIATNAGGNSVIRYGMTREQLLGVEAVLADGTVISSLSGVLKNNTGYDLKQLFIGSEGTLGVITRAVLRLRPLPRSCNTALVAIAQFDQLGQFLHHIDAALGGTLSAFEVMWNDFYTLVIGDGSKHGTPLEPTHEFYVLLESTGGHQQADQARFESALEQALGEGLLVDATIAQSKQQRNALWGIRDDIEGLVEGLYPPMTFDISLDISQMDDYVGDVRRQLSEKWPDSKMVVFGHLGDGNIHLVITVGSLEETTARAVESIIYQALGQCSGVVSAEHGIGLFKRAYLKYSRSPAEITLMRTLKRALDPRGILNPGKIFRQNSGAGTTS